MEITGGLPEEVVQRIVRQNLGRFRLCYENALGRDSKIAGTIVAKVLVDQTGAVARAETGPGAPGTTVADAALVNCVLLGFKNLTFPAPDHGTVTFVYPITFSPPAP
jgi:hypothetical protein